MEIGSFERFLGGWRPPEWWGEAPSGTAGATIRLPVSAAALNINVNLVSEMQIQNAHQHMQKKMFLQNQTRLVGLAVDSVRIST